MKIVILDAKTLGNDIDYSVGGSVSDAVSEVTEYANAKKNDPYGSWYIH